MSLRLEWLTDQATVSAYSSPMMASDIQQLINNAGSCFSTLLNTMTNWSWKTGTKFTHITHFRMKRNHISFPGAKHPWSWMEWQGAGGEGHASISWRHDSCFLPHETRTNPESPEHTESCLFFASIVQCWSLHPEATVRKLQIVIRTNEGHRKAFLDSVQFALWLVNAALSVLLPVVLRHRFGPD